MLFLGIDQSLQSCGVALIETGRPLPLELFNINPHPREDAARLAYIRDRVAAVLRGRDIVNAAIEGYSYGSQVGRFFELGEIGGVMRTLFFDLRIPYIVVAPAALKKFATANASADKEKMAAGIKRKWNVTIEQDDQADAFALAKVAELYVTHTSRFREELEVVHSLKNKRTSDLKPRTRTARVSL